MRGLALGHSEIGLGDRIGPGRSRKIRRGTQPEERVCREALRSPRQGRSRDSAHDELLFAHLELIASLEGFAASHTATIDEDTVRAAEILHHGALVGDHYLSVPPRD